VSGVSHSEAILPPFPGATGITGLNVYDWSSEDGLRGGAPHVHQACSECYVVISGHGALHTLTNDGVCEVTLDPGDVVWFTPGTIHRSVNTDGALKVVVVMENGGLPEAGDAVLTFPSSYLADPERYRQAVSLVGEDGHPSLARARERRDLALEGFRELRERTEAGDGSALADFYGAAARLVKPRLAEWQIRWEAGAHAAALDTAEQISALERGDYSHLFSATVSRIARPEEQVYGMCGILRPYDPHASLAA
jgi:mannose-6-phosphate isomerase-like protein (cupin superfamily)